MDASELFNERSALYEMADDLSRLGYAKDAAAETLNLIRDMASYEVRAEVAIKRLRDVWKARDYWMCNDTTEDDFKESLSKYREGKP